MSSRVHCRLKAHPTVSRCSISRRLGSMPLTVNVLARELLLLRKDDNRLRIPCAWGVDPSLAFLPPAQVWDSVVPGWLHGRRAEAVAAVEQFGLLVKDDDRPVSHGAFGRGEPPNSTAGPIATVTTLGPIPMDESRRRGRETRP